MTEEELAAIDWNSVFNIIWVTERHLSNEDELDKYLFDTWGIEVKRIDSGFWKDMESFTIDSDIALLLLLKYPPK